jgi:hypothetical protein
MMMSLIRRADLRVVAALLLTMAVGSACGQGAAAARCDAVEPSTDLADYHVLPDAEVSYELSPPAGGPHYGGPPPSAGVVSESLDDPAQVSALEAGLVLVQYDDSLSDDDRARLEDLTDEYDELLVAPANGPIDRGQPVALTAWGSRQLCDGVDLPSVRAFLRTYPVAPPGADQ